MKKLCFFFSGFFLLVSANQFGEILNFNEISLLCNFCGVVLMMLGTKLYVDQMQVERSEFITELKSVSEKMITTEEYKKLEQYIENFLEIQENSQKIFLSIYENIADFQKQDSNFNIQLNKDIEKILMCQTETQKVLESSIKTVGDRYEKKFDENGLKIDALKKLLEKESEINNEMMKEILSTMIQFQRIPEQMVMFSRELDEQVERYVSESRDQLESLVEAMEEHDEKRTKGFDRMMRSLETYNQDECDDLMEKMEMLSREYENFEKVIKEIVSQMTQMSEKDYEIMRGLINE